MHYPTVSASPDRVAPNQGKDWNLPAQMKDYRTLSKIENPQWPLREGFSKDNGQGKILTNHFDYTLTTEKLYEYRILDLPIAQGFFRYE